MKFSNVLILFYAMALAIVCGQKEISKRCQKKLNCIPIHNVLTTDYLEKDRWEMVFRATAGNGDDAYTAWTSGTDVTKTKPTSMKRSNSKHFRNDNVDKWDTLGIKYVKYAFYTEEEEVAYVIFDGVGSDINNWFAQNRVIYSSWPNLKSKEFNHFSTAGHESVKRYFFISNLYKGCPGDLAYMVVKNEAGPCAWDKHPAYPQFLYSRFTTADFMERRMFGLADYMAIFIKTDTKIINY